MVTTTQYAAAPRALNQVQNVMRWLIGLFTFFAVFIVLGLIGLLVSTVAGAVVGQVSVGGVCLVPWAFVSGIIGLVLAIAISRCFYIIPEYERVVVLKLGEFVGVRGPGRFWVIPYPPYYQSAAMTLDMRIQTQIIKAAQTLTMDNVPVGCEAVLFWRVEDPRVAALKVKNHAEAVYLAANSALKDTIGTLELSDLLSQRDMVAQSLKHIIDEAAREFGVDVSSVEITDVHVPPDLIQELSVRAQSERAAQAKIVEAKAELQVARQFQQAAESMSGQAMEIYRLNVLERIGREEGSQIVVYGLGGGSEMGTQIAATSAGAMAAQPRTGKAPPASESAEPA